MFPARTVNDSNVNFNLVFNPVSSLFPWCNFFPCSFTKVKYFFEPWTIKMVFLSKKMKIIFSVFVHELKLYVNLHKFIDQSGKKY